MKVPAPQPKRISSATAKTNPSETPFASAPSTGTGKRSARVEATRKANTPRIVVADPGLLKKETVAARYAATPTRETGATTASSLAGGSARPLIVSGRLLPGEVDDRPGEIGEAAGERNEQRNDQDHHHLRVPLEHGIPPVVV